MTVDIKVDHSGKLKVSIEKGANFGKDINALMAIVGRAK